MKIVDLSPEYESLYQVCLEDWSDDMREAGGHKARWVEAMKPNGLRVKIALDDDGKAVGFIEYLPMEYSIAEGGDGYFINCIWVHGHKQGVGDMRKRGYGSALLAAAEEDAKARGAKGMAAYGLAIPVWIPASFFRARGYRAVDKDGIARLMFKPFAPDAGAPKLIKPRKKPKAGQNPGRVTVTFLLDGYCPGRNIAYERTKRAVAEFGDQAALETVDVLDRQMYLQWGMRNELFIEDKHIGFGPPPSYEKIKRLIEKRVRRLKQRR